MITEWAESVHLQWDGMNMRSILLLTLAAPAFAGDPIYTFDGDATTDRFGYSVASGADINGDGVPDALVGAPGAPPDLSGIGGTVGSARVVDGATGAVLFQYIDDEPGALFGHAVATLGDLNEDGFADFGVGAPLADAGPFTDSGTVRVYRGGTGLLDYQLDGFGPGDQYGFAIQALGDATGNDFDDFVVGAPGNDFHGVDAGIAQLVFGLFGIELDEFGVPGTPGGRFGSSLGITTPSAASSVDHGVLVGAPAGFQGGRVYVFRTSLTEVVQEKVYNAPAVSKLFGAVVVGDLDFDGDGLRDDFAVAAPTSNPFGIFDAGSVWFYDRKENAAISIWEGQEPSEQFGAAIASVGDVDGDGRDDVLVGSPGSAKATTFSAVGQEIQIVSGDPGLGRSVAGLGDLTGDGLSEVFIGSPLASNSSGVNSGVAFIDHVDNAASGAVADVGAGCGAPVLDMLGDLQAGGTAYLQIVGGPPSGTAFVLIGGGNGSIPLFPGCSLGIAPLAPGVVPLALSATGDLLLPIQVPALVPGSTVFLQAPVTDPNLPVVEVTNAISVTTS